MSSTTDLGQVEAIRLFTSQADGGQMDSVVPLRWCLSQPAVQQLASSEVKRPYLLVVIENEGQEMERYVFSAWDQMRYIQFRRPGNNVVHAAVVWGEGDQSPRKVLLKKDGQGKYKQEVLRPRHIHLEDVLRPRLESLKEEQERVDAEIEDAAQERRKSRNERHRASRVNDQVGALLAELDDEEELLHESTSLVADTAHYLGLLRERLGTEPGATSPEEVDDPELVEQSVRLTAEIGQLEAAIEEAEGATPDEYVFQSYLGLRRVTGVGQLVVEVPAAMFAPEPPSLMKKLAELYTWERKPRDQCNFRRRALITAATLPLFTVWVGLLLVVNAALAAVLLIAGKRNINYTPFRHPCTEGPWALWDDLEPSFWLTTRKPYEDDPSKFHYENRSIMRRAVSPPVVIGLAVVLTTIDVVLTETGVLQKAGVGKVDIWKVILIAVFGPPVAVFVGGAIAVIFAILYNGLQGAIKLLSLLAPRRAKKSAEELAARRRREEAAKLREKKAKEAAESAKRDAEAAAKRREREALEASLRELSCSHSSSEVSIAALPKERRTVVLRYEDLKARVCKPFAQ